MTSPQEMTEAMIRRLNQIESRAARAEVLVEILHGQLDRLQRDCEAARAELRRQTGEQSERPM